MRKSNLEKDNMLKKKFWNYAKEPSKYFEIADILRCNMSKKVINQSPILQKIKNIDSAALKIFTKSKYILQMWTRHS